MATYIPKHNQSSVPPEQDIFVPHDNFYPSLSLSDFRNYMRIDDAVSNSRAKEYIRMAVVLITNDIMPWRKEQYPPLDDIEKVQAWRWAVYHKAKALILENYRDIDTTNDGHNKADALEAIIDSHLQRSREMQQILTNNSRTTIELI